MTVTLHLPPKLEGRLRARAAMKLLQDANVGLPPELWERYHELTRKRRAEKISAKELRELIALCDRVENANVRRLRAAIEYANKHKRDLNEVMRKFKIGRLANV